MKYLDLTLETAALNLACDEALIDWCEGTGNLEVLRIWEPRQAFVVLGYANRAAVEADLEGCRARGIPVLRRCTGGGTVLQGPGCVNFTLVLRMDSDDALRTIPGTNRFILTRNGGVLSALLDQPVRVQGGVDLTVGAFKSSGNAQRRKRTHLLFHGTFLVGLDLELVDAVLRFPSKQPEYRAGRSHREFVRNLPLDGAALRRGLRAAWKAEETLTKVPMDLVERLAREKYSRPEWNLKY
jgi:lipoate-protein ligase A